MMAKRGGWAPTCVVRSEDSRGSLAGEQNSVVVADAVGQEFWDQLRGKWAGMVWSIAPSRKREDDDFKVMHQEGAVRAAKWAKENGVSMVYLSSTSVYAEGDGGWVEESSALAQDERSIAMATAERATIAAGGSVLRSAGLYGPGRELKPDGEGPERWLNVIQVEDAARAVGLLLGKRGEIYNGCEDAPLRRGVTGGTWASPRARARRSKRVSNAKLRATGWTPVHRGF